MDLELLARRLRGGASGGKRRDRSAGGSSNEGTTIECGRDRRIGVIGHNGPPPLEPQEQPNPLTRCIRPNHNEQALFRSSALRGGCGEYRQERVIASAATETWNASLGRRF